MRSGPGKDVLIGGRRSSYYYAVIQSYSFYQGQTCGFFALDKRKSVGGYWKSIRDSEMDVREKEKEFG